MGRNLIGENEYMKWAGKTVAGLAAFTIAAGAAVAAFAQNANLNQSSYYVLSSQLRGTGFALTGSNGDNMFMSRANGSAAQQWRFTAAGNGYYRITAAHRAGDCVDVYNGGDQNNVAHLTNGCQDYSGQFWLVTGSNGSYRLTTEFRGTNMCLQAFRVPGSNTQLRACSDDPGQLWTLTPAG